NCLVACEVALCLALLIGAGLMLRTLLSLRGVDPGFQAQNVVHTQIVLPPSQYTSDRQAALFAQAIERIRVLPSVQAVSAVMCLPLSGSCWSNVPEVEGRPGDLQSSEVNFNTVAPDYFRTLGIALRQGRDFDPHDTKNGPGVAIVSEAFASRYLAGDTSI